MHNFSLTVVVTTYNHELFINDCLQGIVDQITTFPFKVIVGEDCSTDSTRVIVEKFHQKYPDIFEPIYFKKNVGGHQNFITCLNNCKTTWIAWIEGDDFWTDPHKLQKQAEALTITPQATLCFSLANSIIESSSNIKEYGRVFGPHGRFKKKIYNRNDFLISNIVPTCTVMFKREAALPLPSWYEQWHLGDWTLYLHILQSGNAIFLDEVTACYRVHQNGAWSTIPAQIKFEKQISLIKFLIEKELTISAKKILYLNLFSQQAGLTISLLRDKDWKQVPFLLLSSLNSFLKSDWSLKYLRFYFQKLAVFSNYIKKTKRNIL